MTAMTAMRELHLQDNEEGEFYDDALFQTALRNLAILIVKIMVGVFLFFLTLVNPATIPVVLAIGVVWNAYYKMQRNKTIANTP